MSNGYVDSELLKQLCQYLNENPTDLNPIFNSMISAHSIFQENISRADANYRPTLGTRAITIYDGEYKLKFTKTYTQDTYPPRIYTYFFSVGNFSYYTEDNFSTGAMELNEREMTFRYVPRLENNVVNDAAF